MVAQGTGGAEVEGSSPSTLTNAYDVATVSEGVCKTLPFGAIGFDSLRRHHGDLAQLGAQDDGIVKVEGSSPSFSTIG